MAARETVQMGRLGESELLTCNMKLWYQFNLLCDCFWRWGWER